MLVFGLAACASSSDSDGTADSQDNEVKVDTRTPAARAQYDANVAFANAYVPRCQPGSEARPRVLLTGFGRFMSIGDNATGRLVSKLVPTAPYPETSAPPTGGVDPPGPQLSVGNTTLDLPGVGPVDVCGMILSVYWDLAAILISKELEAFDPTFVMMNGVAGDRQPIWVELGATNRAAPLDDGSDQLRPAVGDNEPFAKIVDTTSDVGRPNLLAWKKVETAARTTILAHAEDRENGMRFGDLLPDVKLAGFPRSSNTYLCNNVTFVTGWLMSHPQSKVRLMRASPPKRGAINEIDVKMTKDFSSTPRVFVHWPSELAGAHHAAGAEVMKSILTAQLLSRSESTLGDNNLADPTLLGGAFF